MRIIIFFILFIITNTFAHGEVTTEPDALLLRYPDVGRNAVVFVYAGDIWKAPLEGGVATWLSSPPGNEMFPKFSPDGSTIVFSANYEGNVDVYKIPASGGVPERLTHHPDDDLVVDWYSDGKKVLYRSEMMSHVRRYNRLYLQPAGGGLPEPLPFYYGELATFSQTGSRIAFQYSSRQLGNWKRYAGGMAGDIWIYDFIEGQYKKFTDYSGTDAVPLWHKNRLYFLSDNCTSCRTEVRITSLIYGSIHSKPESSVRLPASMSMM